MPSEARTMMKELREDHRNMAIVLSLLEDAVEEASAGDDPDFELVEEIMRYMTVYPDAVHHPKEDIVYGQLRSKRPDLADGLDDVPGDHADIAALGSNLRDEVEAIVAGAAVRRDKFIEDAGRYVERLRNHMSWEERDLFSRIDKMIEADPQEFDVEAFDHIKDPVFELEVEAGFRRLLGTLKPAS
ncbi:MAG: hemerythrin domain-containing protein [Gammaproteobacteria bacterium]|nr:hemerythrin domain-containing protein [Gammaproteobacteria bacterium]